MTSEPWQETTLGEVAGGRQALQTGPFGSQLRASDYVVGDRGVPVVMPRDLRGGTVTTKKIARVTAAKAAELPRYRLRAGDILLARRGEMGRCARLRPVQEGWLCGTGCLRIRLNGRLDGDFLVQYLRWPVITAWLADHAVGQTVPSINTGILAKIPLKLPGLAEQRRIAAVLGSVDRVIDATRTVIAQVRRVRDEFLRLLLTRGPQHGSRRATTEEFHPDGWELHPLGSLCRMVNGQPFKARDRSAEGLPIIRIQNLNGSRDFHLYAGPPDPERLVEAGDLLFAWAGVKGSSFGPCIWPGPTGVLNQHIFQIRPRDGVVQEWLFEALKLVTREIEQRAHGFKDSLLHLRKSDITEHHVPVPPFEAQQWIADQSRSLTEIERAECSTLESLGRLKRGLVQDLLTGHVRTTSDQDRDSFTDRFR